MTFFSLYLKILIHLTQEAQITLLVIKKITIPIKYLDFTDVFLEKPAAELFKHFAINKYMIGLESGK